MSDQITKMRGHFICAILCVILVCGDATAVTTPVSEVTTALPSSSTPANPQCEIPGLENNRVCQVGSDDKENKLKLLHEVFTNTKRLDMVFLIDGSQSVSVAGIKTALDTTRTVLEYLSDRGLIALHRCLSRIAVVMFESNTITAINGITNERRFFPELNMCNLEEHILRNDNLNINVAFPNSRISAAFDKALEIFQGSDLEQTKKVVWLFSDGDYKKELNYTQKVTELKESGVTLITSGIGEKPLGWFICSEAERAMEGIATSPNLYACASNWTNFLQTSTKTREDALQIEFSPVGKENVTCGECSTSCVCNVKTHKYECKNLSTLDVFNSLTCPARVPTPESKDSPVVSGPKLPLPVWLIVVITVLGTLVVIVMPIAIVIACVKFKRRQPKGPPLPPPNILRRLRNNQLEKDHIYGNMADLHDDPAGERALIDLYQQVDGLDLSMIDSLEVYEAWHVEEEIIMEASAYENNNERNLPGWADYMEQLKRVYSISHLMIVSSSCNRAAWTEGFKLPYKELEKIEKMFGEYERLPASTSATIVLKGTEFQVNLPIMTPNQIYAYRKELSPPPREITWVSKAGDYLIVTVAQDGMEEQCKKIAGEIMQYLNIVMDSEYAQYDNVKRNRRITISNA